MDLMIWLLSHTGSYLVNPILASCIGKKCRKKYTHRNKTHVDMWQLLVMKKVKTVCKQIQHKASRLYSHFCFKGHSVLGLKHVYR